MSEVSTPDRSERPASFPWPPLLLITALLAGWMTNAIWPLPWPGVDDTPARTIGTALGLGGLALAIWAVVTLHRSGTTVLPHRGATTLVTSGPFGYLRNPIYVADVLILLGVAELTKNIWIVIFAAAFVGLVTWLAILPEERHLEEKFANDYLDYKSRTRRWI